MSTVFNDGNRVTMGELSDDLQKIINDKAEKVELEFHASDTDIHITPIERSDWNAIRDDLKKHIDDVFSIIVGDNSTLGMDIVAALKDKLSVSKFDQFLYLLPKVAKTGNYDDLINKPSSVSFSDSSNYSYNTGRIDGVRFTIGAIPPGEPAEGQDIWFDVSGDKFIIKAFVNNKWVANSSVIL